MPIITSQLIAAPMLQDYLVDKNALPLSAGIVTCFHDNSRTVLKNWYYQSGSPGAYTYIALPNPLTLSAAGTIADVNGNDTIPFFYPWSELDSTTFDPYYITVQNSSLQQEFTRQNFPFVPNESPGPGVGELALNNLIINNRFWRNIGSLNTSGTVSTAFSATLAPSQHDGFAQPDIIFIKNTGGATDTTSFMSFGLGNTPLINDITPEFYINHTCSAAGTGETLKAYQFPISLHVNTLDTEEITITLQAQNTSGSSNGVITISIYQFLGSGVTSSAPLLVSTQTLNNSWTKIVVPFPLPSTAGLVLGQGSDDAYYLQIGMPLNNTCNINFTLPSVFLTTDIAPINDFQTYDQIDAIINSPRTGDIRTSLNTFQPFGWVAANDGTIGLSGASTRSNADTWPLYNLLYNTVNNQNAPVAGGRSGNAYADFIAAKVMSLPASLGYITAGANGFTNASQVFTTNYGVSHFNLTVVASAQYKTGTPIQVFNTGGALPSALSSTIVYFIININATTVQLATTLENAYGVIPLDIGSDQSGTSTIMSANGATAGNTTMTLTNQQLPAHSHGIASPGVDFIGSIGSGGTFGPGSGSTLIPVAMTATVGIGAAFSLMQRTNYRNIFIKL